MKTLILPNKPKLVSWNFLYPKEWFNLSYLWNIMTKHSKNPWKLWTFWTYLDIVKSILFFFLILVISQNLYYVFLLRVFQSKIISLQIVILFIHFWKIHHLINSKNLLKKVCNMNFALFYHKNIKCKFPKHPNVF